jgi:hypothetical protein
MTNTRPEHIEKLLSRWSYSPAKSEAEVVTSRTLWRIAYSYWMKFARALGKANALVLLTIVYVVLIGPAAIVLRIFGKDLLDRKAGESLSYWYEKENEQLTLERSKQQF